MLNTLNADIYQTATMVAKLFEGEGGGDLKEEGPGGEDVAKMSEDEEPDMVEIYASATENLGSQMVMLLQKSDHQDPMIIQIAVQAGMSSITNWMVSEWSLVDPEEARMLSEIYVRVRETGQFTPPSDDESSPFQ